ncbi:hypothetical protein BT96DRAFT_1097333 [Gymnopus androsaceus JB14]|uniref:glycogenin glucosyltransferase n=1 Tax=Gymnopus androsaceus JB14 TaxID=1447944 RepID=A0A6A4HSB4_9AGAR|nr:hypothetical protein BT96DRAFT_1097333 [Gymnopus androsaceus JB14]
MACPYAFVTLLTSDHYLPGALTLVAALRDIHPSPAISPEVDFQTVCLVTPETVDVSTIKLLRKTFDVVVGVELIAQKDEKGLALLGRPDLNEVLTKLHVFRLTQYSKIIFLDADVLPIRPLSHLFTLPHEFSAVPDVGWPDIFNSGVMVLSPGEDKFSELQDLLKAKGSWDGGDQGILNEWRGNDWNRLSFTYNTTPTAAYTYAPAYERFGKKISAIHFIGPNKPWKSIQFRAPFLSQREHPESSQRAYDYDGLVDKWFHVYDTHYRAQSIVPDRHFEVQKYVSAWDEGASSSGGGGALGLEELRRLAIQGLNSTGLLPENRFGEGEYKSLPLEGRVDLMRLQPPSRATEEKEEHLISFDTHQYPQQEQHQQQYHQQQSDWPRTPAPHEIPPSPHPLPISLPSTPSSGRDESAPHYENQHQQQNYAPAADHVTISACTHLQHQQQNHGDYRSPAPQPQHQQQNHGDYQAPAPHLQHQQQNHGDYRSPAPQPQHQQQNHGDYQAPAPHLQHQQQNYGDYQSPAHQSEHQQQNHGDYQSPAPQPQHQQQNHGDYQSPVPQPHLPPPQEHRSSEFRHHSPPRPPSPPKLLWNPAIEPPPNTAPPPSAFPSDTYFQNIWDQPPSKHHDHTHQSHQHHHITSPPPDSGAFFQLPPPSLIPESLLMQGHYRNVTGDSDPASSEKPEPDLTKVKPVFPWEDKPRIRPGRVFPASDPTPPTWGLPTTLSYANAWDTVPSIQRYASRLVRPPPPPPPAVPFDSEDYRRGRKSWDDRTEASSRDGDDEDNTDSDDDEPVVSRLADSDNETSVSGSTSRTRSRRGSSVSASYGIKAKKKEYRVRGVQTISPEMKEQAVQVSILVDSPKVSNTPTPSQDQKNGSQETIRPQRTSLSLQTGGSRKPQWAPSPASSTLPPVVSRGQNGSPGSTTPTGTGTGRGGGDALNLRFSPPSDALSPREFIDSPGPRARSNSSAITPSTVRRSSGSPQIFGTPPLEPFRQTSNESLITSPPSSTGPISPPEGQPIGSVVSPTRKVGRVFDPARGVELFKRGSEEVLARFLKMSSWEEDSSPQR